MKIINESCESIAKYIAKELELNGDQTKVINYGIVATIQMSICIILVVIFGIIFNVLIESLLISFSMSILRKSSGGVHAESPEKCAVIGTSISVVLAVISQRIQMSMSLVYILGVILFTWSFFTIYKLAPVDSKHKPIKSISKRNRLKKYSIMTVMGYLILIIVLNLILNNSSFIKYALCIYMGTFCQVCSLITIGKS